MVIVWILVVVVVLAVFALVARSRFSKQAGDEVEETAHAIAPAADVNREFERPRDQDEPPVSP